MEVVALLFAAAGAGSLVTLWVQALKRRAAERRARAPMAATLNALDANTIERVVSALDRFDRRLEAVEQRMEFSEKLLLQPSERLTSRHAVAGRPDDE